MRNISLKIKLPILVALVATLGFGTTVGIITYIQEKNAKEQAFELAKATAHQVGNKVKAEIETALDASRTLAYSFEGLKLENITERPVYNAVLKRVLSDSENFFSVWTCWEPNALDGKDADFANKTASDGYDKTGRFIPYWNRPEKTVNLEPLVDYETPGNGDYYLLAKKSGDEVIIEPYEYPVAGKKVLMTSLVVPIKDNARSKVLGVTGIDIDLIRVQNIVRSIKLEHGYAVLFSSTGIIATDPTGSNIMKKIGDVYPMAKNAVNSINQQQSFTYLDADSNHYYVSVPVQFGNTKTYWGVLIKIPLDDVLADISKVRTLAITTSIVSIVLISGIMIVLLNMTVNSPLRRLELAMESVTRSGRFKQQIEVTSNDEIGKILKAFNVLLGTIDHAISEIKMITNELSKGNLQARIKHQFDGDLGDLKQNINQSMINLSTTLSKVIHNTQLVAESSNQTSSAISDVAEGSSRQLSTIDSIVHFVNENVQLLQDIRQGLREARENAKLSTESTQRGSEQMEQMVRISQVIVDSSNKINRITSVIGEIAEKTNLLALNAAIESARAGESGKGFAIVADEVRKLAENSAIQVAEISSLVTEAVKQAGESLTLAHNVNGEITNIRDHVKSNSDLFVSIREKIEKQNQSMEELNQQATLLRSIAESNSSNAQEVSSTVENLSDVAQDTRNYVDQFKI